MYNLVNNISKEKNHLTRIKKLFNTSDTVIITSPFLMTDFDDFLDEISSSLLKKIHLITTLKPNSLDQLKKVSSLVSLIEYPKIKNELIQCQISFNNKLHGKIYIFKKDNSYISAIITSANFTVSGLSNNHEWGIEIFDKKEILELEKSILDNIEYDNVDFDDIQKMQLVSNAFLAKNPINDDKKMDLDLSKQLSSPYLSAEHDNTIYWLKPIGVTHDPVEDSRLFNKKEDMLNFSKIRPSGVKPNHILIAYGVGPTKILTLYKVITNPQHATEQQINETEWFERWPWYIIGENLTPKFGSYWSKQNLYINNLKDDFLKTYPNESITAVGGKTLGGLNFGKDKLMLSPNFAKYIINKVTKINTSLK